jgi:hypothetical protein
MHLKPIFGRNVTPPRATAKSPKRAVEYQATFEGSQPQSRYSGSNYGKLAEMRKIALVRSILLNPASKPSLKSNGKDFAGACNGNRKRVSVKALDCI